MPKRTRLNKKITRNDWKSYKKILENASLAELKGMKKHVDYNIRVSERVK